MGGKAALVFIAAAPWLITSDAALCIATHYTEPIPERNSSERLERNRAARAEADRVWDRFKKGWDACVDTNSADACYGTGEALENGKGVAVDMSKAHWFYDKACALEATERRCAAARRTAGAANPSQTSHGRHK